MNDQLHHPITDPLLPFPSAPVIYAVELKGIDKTFKHVHANKHISMQIQAGTIHGIVGENGAGKSTLMNILYGYIHADAGDIYLFGEKINIRSSHDAIAAGIGMVFQHFMLIDRFSVLDNIILGVEKSHSLERSRAQARAVLEEIERNYKLEVDLDAKVEDLSVGLLQRVEILKALYRDARILILDEPTAVLTPQETDHLFRILIKLKEQGKTIVLISHKLREILSLTDTVSVMRRGEIVANVKTHETTANQLAEYMVGRKVILRVEKTPARPGPVVLQIDSLVVNNHLNHEAVRNVSFALRAGEIVGIAGVAGNGQSELLEALAGILPIQSGFFTFKDQAIDQHNPKTPDEIRGMGIAHIPEDRLKMGLVPHFKAFENSILGYQNLPKYQRFGLLQRQEIIKQFQKWTEKYDIRPAAPYQKARAFSGGNQQKIVIAREIESNPDVLLVGQPTRGVDIGAIEFIHNQLIILRDQGKAILLVSVELDEIVSLSDRILVMCGGKIVGETTPDDASERKLGLMMAGYKDEGGMV